MRSPWPLVGIVALLTFGAIASLWVDVLWLWLSSFGWLVVAWLGPRSAAVDRPALAWLALVATFGWAATMAGVAAFAIDGPGLHAGERAHAAFGEHAVRVLAGAPWPGIEGHGGGGAHERLSFGMGIDAMLVNFGFWALVAAALLRRADARRVAELFSVGSCAAALAGLAGGWRLVVLFD